MTEFILNDRLIRSDCPEGMALLDFIRNEAGLSGTKCGCREGDCGACTVMEGVLVNGNMAYRSIVSCLTPLGNVHGKHIVTVEGIFGRNLHPVQQAMIHHSATQCGFCSPGIVMSLVSASLSPDPRKRKEIPGAISGNICRCTGYKSIEKAAEVINELAALTNGCDPVLKMVETGYLPEWFLPIPGRLAGISKPAGSIGLEGLAIGGGTDLMVQQPEKIFNGRLNFTGKPEFRGIESDGKTCTIGAGETITDLMQSEILLSILPGFEKHLRLVSSEQIRNMGTVGGNLVNASPIADLAIVFLVFDTMLLMCDHAGNERIIPLKDFYLGYKILDRKENEIIRSLRFRIPKTEERFNFEKVSKREHLDIASVNSAISVQLEGNRVTSIRLSAGGVAPVPKFLAETCRFITGRELSPEMLLAANRVMQDEISPISDIRGSAEYKRLLIRQLLFAHFLELFPGKLDPLPLITLSSQK